VSNHIVHDPSVKVTDSNQALNYLKEGNKRFIEGNFAPRNYKADLEATKTSQKPFAAILTCADSRLSPEIFFDQKIGNIFVVRNAGNYADSDALGSLEFATKHLGAPLVAVVGHSMCGAVFTAHDDATGLSSNLQSAIDTVKGNIKGSATREEAITTNVKKQVEVLKNNPVIKETGAMVVGAEYDIATGVVTFL